jgi:hypothetical protein
MVAPIGKSASGVAAVKLAKGRYELVVWKTGYDSPATPIIIDADTFALEPKDGRR